jgi:hypothetical protein
MTNESDTNFIIDCDEILFSDKSNKSSRFVAQYDALDSKIYYTDANSLSYKTFGFIKFIIAVLLLLFCISILFC